MCTKAIEWAEEAAILAKDKMVTRAADWVDSGRKNRDTQREEHLNKQEIQQVIFLNENKLTKAKSLRP